MPPTDPPLMVARPALVTLRSPPIVPPETLMAGALPFADITLAGGSDTNYSLVLSNGTLTVTQAVLTATALLLTRPIRTLGRVPTRA